jgi:hypothetical protein
MRSMIMLALAADLLSGSANARAESPDPNAKIPTGLPTAFATAPNGARYYPGVGFRYVLPPSERVYGYTAGTRVYAYQARNHRRSCHARDFWFWERHGACGYARER